MKLTRLSLLLACLLPCLGQAADFNVATLSCDKYENVILGPAADHADPAKSPDSINTVMWLFGYSVAKAGEHFMYGDSLSFFGFALDAECKNNPSTSLLEALTAVRPKHDKPMDLTTLNCATWESRHEISARNDPDSAMTIMMWLFGYSVGLSGGHLYDSSGLPKFSASLQARCTQHPEDSLFDSLTALNKSARP